MSRDIIKCAAKSEKRKDDAELRGSESHGSTFAVIEQREV